MSLTGKIALVTGGGRGIGRAICLERAAQGANIALVYAGNTQAAEETAEACRALGVKASCYQCDVADFDAVKETVARSKADFGGVQILVNNAGVACKVRLNILETTPESFERLMKINCEGTFFMCQGAANRMIACQKKSLPDYTPRIVNISSISAYTSSTSRGEYCISKAGISMVTQLFADELADYGIPVFEVRPGIIATDMTAVVHEKYEKMIAEGITPIRRFGQPEDVANCVLAASSGLLDFGTGTVLNADGGFHIRRL